MMYSPLKDVRVNLEWETYEKVISGLTTHHIAPHVSPLRSCSSEHVQSV